MGGNGMRLDFRNPIVLLLSAGVVLGGTAFLLWQNQGLMTTELVLHSERIPPGFNGYRIVHLSDLHNKRFGGGQERLLNRIREASPDLIVITGDLVDKRRTDLDIAMELVEGAAKIAPICYAPGNHEGTIADYGELKRRLRQAGVTVLEDGAIFVSQGDDTITVLGMRDPRFFSPEDAEGEGKERFAARLRALSEPGRGDFIILLSHRPEMIDLYAACQPDLVCCGHAHGGQFRLPLIGGLFAPGQGFFPRYTSGAYSAGRTTMVVSRGLGNSGFPIRLFNRPEVICLILKRTGGQQGTPLK